MRPPALAAILVTGVLAATNASADDDEFSAALSEFDAAVKALPATAPCDTMCKALQSMIHAANRICELARDGNATEQQRCTDAKTKVADATARVRANCPNCDTSPPSAATEVPKPATGKKPTSDDTKTVSPAPPPMEPGLAKEESAAYMPGVIASARKNTIALDVIALFAPPVIAQLRYERYIASRFSFAVVGAFGSLPKTGPNGDERATAWGVGGELRGYLFGSFDRFGIFLGADVMYRRANGLASGEYLEARAFPPGVTAGALVGTKLVLRSGLTIEARIGPSFVLDDRRDVGPRPTVLPSGGVSLGWSF